MIGALFGPVDMSAARDAADEACRNMDGELDLMALAIDMARHRRRGEIAFTDRCQPLMIAIRGEQIVATIGIDVLSGLAIDAADVDRRTQATRAVLPPAATRAHAEITDLLHTVIWETLAGPVQPRAGE